MTTATDIANWALKVPGTRTNVTDAELAGNSTNEAIQINLTIDNVRRRLLRMAPWNHGMKTANLIYITSAPGTPENTMAATTLWSPGQPAPPWCYEYQFPVDCLRMCFVIPSTQTGFAGGIPITTAVTGGAASFWQGPPVKFKVQNDTFVPVIAASVVSGGTGFAVGDIAFGPGMLNPTTGQQPTAAQGLQPVGGPVQLLVTAVGVGGAITTVSVISQVLNTQTAPPQPGIALAPITGGSYFAQLPNPVPMSFTTGAGSGATFNLTYSSPSNQRVVLTNQEFAIGSYIQDITDPDTMDANFIETWAKALGAEITIPLTGDKKLANMAIQEVNNSILWSRANDGNEAFTVNDVTPDWMRIRGIDFPQPYSGPYTGFDWGGMYPIFG
jgi:hypothetical protein